MDGRKTVLIATNSSSQIGFSLGSLLASDEHYQVFIAVDKGESENQYITMVGNKSNLATRELNFRSNAHMSKLSNEILTTTKRIDALVCDTGAGISGPIESVSLKVVKDIFDTNVFNLVRVVKEVLPVMKSRNTGHIVIISGVHGVIGMPFNSVSSSSMFAIEGLAEALAMEVLPYHIKLSLIEPGPVVRETQETSSNKMSKSTNIIDKLTYDLFTCCKEKQSGIFETMGQTPECIAVDVVEVIKNQNPQFRYMTNKLYSSALAEKLSDNTGNDVLSSLKKVFSN